MREVQHDTFNNRLSPPLTVTDHPRAVDHGHRGASIPWSWLPVVNRTFFGFVLIVITITFGTGCATTGEFADEGDPYEGFNRSMTTFNDNVNRYALDPVSRVYVKIPRPVRNRVSSFFRNLDEPNNAVNGLLQGKIIQGIDDVLRFIINSTVGLLGFFDVAKHFGLPRHEEDFGQTFAVWGIGSGPYLVLPFLGPHNARAAIGRIPYAYYLNPIWYIDTSWQKYTLFGIGVIDANSRLAGTRRLLDLQLDPYIFTRESYRQRRDTLIAE